MLNKKEDAEILQIQHQISFLYESKKNLSPFFATMFKYVQKYPQKVTLYDTCGTSIALAFLDESAMLKN